ncbi:hypothetical protein N9W89_11805 [Hellea sp.]|nr:hypothetical protein [Hellea sp.]
MKAHACIPLKDYKSPSLPAQRAASLWAAKFLSRVSTGSELIAPNELDDIEASHLDALAAPPACKPALEALETETSDWLENPHRSPRVKVFVMPPCDDNDVIEAWANAHDFSCLKPPKLSDIAAGIKAVSLPKTDQVCVIPRLEDWMIRTYKGLHMMRALLKAISNSDGRFVIGCNAYAWEFLRRAVRVDHYLPEPITFAPFEGPDLRDWFAEISDAPQSETYTFKDQKSGEDILDEQSERGEAYFKTLAATSHGIPWVAWSLWRGSLLTKPPTEKDDDKELVDNLHTLWVSSLQELSLPGSDSDMSLLVIHSLLIHNGLAESVLPDVLPNLGNLSVIPLLLDAGILHRQGGKLKCRPEAYPAIRKGLSASGFPMGVL